MKKLGIILLMILVLTGCSKDDSRTEFEKTMEYMDSEPNVKIDIEFKDLPLFGTLTGTMIVDGDFQYIEILGETGYVIYEDDDVYNLEMLDGVYYKIKQDVEELEENADDLMGAFTAFTNLKEEDFDFIDGYYLSNVAIDKITDMSILIEDDKIIEMEFTLETEGVSIIILMEFSEYGTASIEMPEYEELGIFEEALFYFTRDFYEYENTSDGFKLTRYFTEISYIEYYEYYTITQVGQIINYYPIDQSIVVVYYDMSIMEYTLEDYLESDEYQILYEEDFEALHNIYENYEHIENTE